MNKEEIIKKIDEVCEMNREHKRNVNHELCKIRNEVQKWDEDDSKEDKPYDVKSFELAIELFNMDFDKRAEIFDVSRIIEITGNFKTEEIMKRLVEYKNKEAAKNEPKWGDIVDAVCYANDCTYNQFNDLIFLSRSETHYTLLDHNNELFVAPISSTKLFKRGEQI